MLDTTADSWYTWTGLTVASLAVGGAVLGLPTGVAPAPGPLAETVDRVATSEFEEVERVPTGADRVRLGPRRVALERGDARSHATLDVEVTPATSGPLTRVLEGAPPRQVFDEPVDFAAALSHARERDPRWRPASETLTVRRVRWEGVDATLVG